MTAETGGATGSLRSALRHKGFGRFLTATVVSAAGDFLNSVGLVVVIYRATGSAGWLGAAAAARVAAWAVATAAGGVVSDRFDRRQVLVVLNAAAGGVALCLALVASVDGPVVAIIGVSMLLDVATGLVNPSFAAAVPALVGEDDVAAANAAVTTVEQVSVVVGPALGAILVAVFSPEVVFALNGVTFLVAAALLAGVAAGGNVADDGSPPARFRDGLVAVRASRPATVLLAVFVTAVFSYGFSLVLFVLVAVERLDLASSGIGYLRMAEGVGGVVAAVVAGRFASRTSSAPLVGAALVTGSVPVLLALTQSVPLSLTILAVGGASYVVLEVIVVTWLQRVTPDALLGRVMGLLMSFGAIGTAAGTVLAPILERTVGLEWALAVSGLVLIVVVGVVIPTLPDIAREAARGGRRLEPIVTKLRALDMFSAADDLTLEQLASAAVAVDLEPGVTVITEGDEPDDLYVVRLGEVEVHASASDGSQQRLATLGPDTVFGEVGLLTGKARNASVTTQAPVSLWRIPGDVFTAASERSSLRPDLSRTGIAVHLPVNHPVPAMAAGEVR